MTGEWDLVAVVRAPTLGRLADVVTVDIAKLEGIRRTETMVAFRDSRHDLDAPRAGRRAILVWRRVQTSFGSPP